MVVSDYEELGSLGYLHGRKRKGGLVTAQPPSTNFNFPAPGAAPLPGAPLVPPMPGMPSSGAPAVKGSAAAPSSPTIAPTMAGGIQEYLPWIVGGAVVLLGGALIYLSVKE